MRYIVSTTQALAAVPPLPTAPPVAPRVLDQTTKLHIERSVKSFIALQASLSGVIDPSTKRIDASVDRALIQHIFIALASGKLTNAEKNYARDRLRAELGV